MMGAAEGAVTDVGLQILYNVVACREWDENLWEAAQRGALFGGPGAALTYPVMSPGFSRARGRSTGWGDPSPVGDVPGGHTLTRNVELIGFRGVSPSNWINEYAVGDEIIDDLAQFGHVGVSFNRGKTIYGFRPSDAAMEMPDLDPVLRHGGTVPGQVFDDTTSFINAHRLSQEGVMGNRTRPYVMQITVSEQEAARMQQAVVAQVADPSLTSSPYRFPELDEVTGLPLPMPPGCNNCATWPRTLGIPIPEETGQLYYRLPDGTKAGYIIELMKRGKPWIPPVQ
jgi:hypothetical protein